MKLPKRFALSTLLLLMLVAALVFGYAQWRRQWLRMLPSHDSTSLLLGLGVPSCYQHLGTPSYFSAVLSEIRPATRSHC